MVSGQFEDEVEPTVSIQEYLKGVEEQELEADLVLGGDEGKECTYAQGYMKRQAIFSCLTCAPNGNAGICTACSLSCHDGHEIVELWTKRNFRCDCGNSMFGESFCKLFPNKDTENVKNSYNHNFKGSYCTCGRPYPDPDVEDQVEMMQCCMCEDWFHEEHIGLESPDEIPRDEEGEPLYYDFICQSCSGVCSFLLMYPQTIWAAGKQGDATANNRKDKDVSDTSVCVSEKLESDLCHNIPNVNNEIANGNFESGISEENSDKSVTLNECGKYASPHTCVVGIDLLGACPVLENKSLFLNKSWRDTLCRCAKCIEFYNQKGITFLLDKDDSISEYEKMAKQKREEKLQQQEGDELSLFNKLGHVKKIEILHGIEDMKNEITSFLGSFDSSKPITSDDVHQVFENLAKKRRQSSDGIYFPAGFYNINKSGAYLVCRWCVDANTTECVRICTYLPEDSSTQRPQQEQQSGFVEEGSIRVKIMLTKEELQWLMLQLQDNNNGVKKVVEDVLREVEKARTKLQAWKPSLESITESPEVDQIEI